MRQASLIGHVVEVFTTFWENPNIPADSIIRDFFFNRKYLGSTDRRFIADAYFTTVKHYRRLEAIVRDAFGTESTEDVPEVSPLEIAIAYCMVFLETPVDEMMRLWKEIEPALPHASEALRRMTDRGREIERLAALPPDERLAIAYSFPIWFVERMRIEYGDREVEAMLAAMNDEAPTALRTNTIRTDRESLRKELIAEGCETAISKIAETALILPKRMNIFGMEAFQHGDFEIQDEASQLVAPFAEIPQEPIRVLDACAGAGGKTLHLAAIMDNRGEIYATDRDGRKLLELKKRRRRSGAQNIRIVLPEERSKRLGKDKHGWFDLVVLDVPCTGTGTLRRNPGIKWILTEEMLSSLLEVQRGILEENIKYVKPGGTLLYATCSVLKEEAEDQIAGFLEPHPEFTLEAMLRTRPDKEGCDGFFAARLRKT
jgi:16S rRNA (cytosine967-C5)-methyltransferase